MMRLKHFEFKRFGYLEFSGDLPGLLAQYDYQPFVKVVFVKNGGKVVIDFQEYSLTKDSVFFINAGQYYQFGQTCEGMMLYYNRDFYCVEIHDKEVACDGILFHNVYEIPVIEMDEASSAAMYRIFMELKEEYDAEESSMEEMLRILLKQIIIRSTRLWKQAHHSGNEEVKREIEFSRNFSQLIEWNYMQLHTVADYAELLKVSPKVLNKRIVKYNHVAPNDLIKDRIILEAKRLLVHTELSVKEIGYKLGYDDPSYFIRLFRKQAKMAPQQFRLQYQS
ncbi:transcriptional regulator, AraC family protein [Pedobacter sp. BAL39]|uniref:helix-turn-helix domain-containing protein n=1 Tax=Pedobacter sp. BAL39 TaxID=391596 RepID=UPI000155A4B0|nr:response regulator transcription factor [Pedobacter sp. BAL39]EDM34323.1 transcriptional regulator, AraC family protein [Pedobacter sp. BAL39]